MTIGQGIAVGIMAACVIGLGVAGLRRWARTRPVIDREIAALIAERGVSRDGERRRFTGFDPFRQKAATERRIAQLQASIGQQPAQPAHEPLIALVNRASGRRSA